MGYAKGPRSLPDDRESCVRKVVCATMEKSLFEEYEIAVASQYLRSTSLLQVRTARHIAPGHQVFVDCEICILFLRKSEFSKLVTWWSSSD